MCSSCAVLWYGGIYKEKIDTRWDQEWVEKEDRTKTSAKKLKLKSLSLNVKIIN